MRAFLFLFCTTVFSFSSGDVFSQHAKITIDSNRTITVDEVFKIIKAQTDYRFIYTQGMFKDFPKVELKKGTIRANKLLELSLSKDDFEFKVSKNKTIVIFESPTKNVVKAIPQQQINGSIKDENGEPLPGATIQIKGTIKASSSDLNGNFTIAANLNDILVISYIGFATQEITITSEEDLLIVLKESIGTLDEVQIIAYGTTTKRKSTGTITTVKAEAINQRPVDNVIQALQGQVSGLSISSSNAGIGSPPQILIRGINSITSGTNPLIIIDGVIMNENPGGLLGGSSATNNYQDGLSILNSLNPNDIKSVDVLKDADATSIYGSRGTNGVILITTKGARIGETQVTMNVSTGISRAATVTERLNTKQYLEMRQDAFAMGNVSSTSAINPITPDNYNAPDLTLWDQTAYTDFTRLEVDNPAPSYNADISLSGGTTENNFITSVSYAKKYDTYIFDPYQERYNFRFQYNHRSKNNKLKLSINSTMGIDNQKFTTLNVSGTTAVSSVNAPNYEWYNEDGSYNYGAGQGYISGSYYNSLPNKHIDRFSKTYNTMLSGLLSYEFFTGITGKIQVNYGSQRNNYKWIYPTPAINVQNTYQPVPTARFSTALFQSLNIEPQLTYSTTVSKASITALVGATFLKDSNDNTGNQISDPGDDSLLYNYSAGTSTATSSSSVNKFNSIFARLGVEWDEKYITNITFRRDGSSRFGPSNRYANFSSIGLAWIFTEEEWLNDSELISFGKLRGSIGNTGNNNIGNYRYLSLLGSPYQQYQDNAQLDPGGYANPDVQWEETKKMDLGLSLGFLNDRFLLNATYYKSLSSNLLVELPLTTQTGFSSYTGNFDGEVQNTGVEFELTSNNLKPTNSFGWKTTFNYTHNKNILKKYDGLEGSPYANTMEVGRALPSTNSRLRFLEMPYHFSGINPENGIPIIEDASEDGRVDYNDYLNNAAWIGPSTPTDWGGMTNTLSYKGFTLDIFLQFSNGIFSKWNFWGRSIGELYNVSTDVIDNYWKQPGDVTKYPRLYTGVTGDYTYIAPLDNYYATSTANLYKGYYIRLKNVRLAYDLPASLLSKLHIRNAQIYVSGENLGVYTPEKLYKDPETFWPLSSGALRTITTGIRVSF
ncbi:SusC/RagA family TonB-linked outer membrane protein [Flavobacteriaceae bacterium F08102]|nr:SusC/RagA family TonB-linked outer membrane protein [Flavobacteriaceae bacterium F08102]